jgi:ABC-2 type transport system permease protein
MRPPVRAKPVAAILLRQYYLLRGSPVRSLPLFAWVAIDIVVWGFITRYLNAMAAGRFNYVPSLLGAVLMWDFFTRIMQGVSTAFLEDVWSRNFLNLFASPLTIREYLLGLVITSIGTSAIGLAVMLVLATAVFGLPFLSLGALLIPFLLVLFGFGIALGILASALVLRLGPASEWLVWPLPALLSPFVGVFYPLATLPRWMQDIGHLLPPSYVFEGLRTALAGRPFAAGSLGVGGALAALDILLAGYFFSRVFRYAIRTGLLARYSAESTS